MGKEFELSFNNKRVRVWFTLVIPALIVSIVLSFLLPKDFQFIPKLIPIIAVFTYWIWALNSKRKPQKKK